MRVWVVAGLFCAGIAFAPEAHADIVTFNFTGEVVSVGGAPSGIWSGQGTVVTGSFSYDTDAADSALGAQVDLFLSDLPVANQALGGWAITVTVGAVTRTTAGNAQPSTSTHHRVTIVDSPTADSWRYEAFRRVVSDDGAQLELVDFPPGIPDGVAAGSDNLTGSLPTTPFDPALFSDTVGRSFYNSFDASGNFEGTVFFTITGITAVPEPGTLALVGAALAGLAWYRRRRR